MLKSFFPFTNLTELFNTFLNKFIVPYRNQGQDLDRTPRLKAWFERIGEREAVKRGMAVGKDVRRDLGASTEAAERARKVLFGQRDA